MKSTTFTANFFKLAAVFVFGICSMVNVQAQESRIGHVSSDRIMNESAPAKAANAKIEREFSSRNKELLDLNSRLKSMASKLDKDMQVIAESERVKRQRELADLDQEFQRKQRAFREDLNQRRNEEIAAVVSRANKAIKAIAESEKYDIILQDAIYYSPRVDITEKVLKALAK